MAVGTVYLRKPLFFYKTLRRFENRDVGNCTNTVVRDLPHPLQLFCEQASSLPTQLAPPRRTQGSNLFLTLRATSLSGYRVPSALWPMRIIWILQFAWAPRAASSCSWGSHDTGKTTLAREILKAGLDAGKTSAYVDADVGESTVGPPHVYRSQVDPRTGGPRRSNHSR